MLAQHQAITLRGETAPWHDAPATFTLTPASHPALLDELQRIATADTSALSARAIWLLGLFQDTDFETRLLLLKLACGSAGNKGSVAAPVLRSTNRDYTDPAYRVVPPFWYPKKGAKGKTAHYNARINREHDMPRTMFFSEPGTASCRAFLAECGSQDATTSLVTQRARERLERIERSGEPGDTLDLAALWVLCESDGYGAEALSHAERAASGWAQGNPYILDLLSGFGYRQGLETALRGTLHDDDPDAGIVACWVIQRYPIQAKALHGDALEFIDRCPPETNLVAPIAAYRRIGGAAEPLHRVLVDRVHRVWSSDDLRSKIWDVYFRPAGARPVMPSPPIYLSPTLTALIELGVRSERGARVTRPLMDSDRAIIRDQGLVAYTVCGGDRVTARAYASRILSHEPEQRFAGWDIRLRAFLEHDLVENGVFLDVYANMLEDWDRRPHAFTGSPLKEVLRPDDAVCIESLERIRDQGSEDQAQRARVLLDKDE